MLRGVMRIENEVFVGVCRFSIHANLYAGGGGGDWYSLNIRGFTFDCATLQYNLVNLNSFVSPLSVTYSV